MNPTKELSDEELLEAVSGEPIPTPITASTGQPQRLKFGGLKEKPKTTGKTEYPTLPDPTCQIARLADSFLTAHANEARAKGAKEAARGQLINLASPFHWQTNCGRAEIAGTVSVLGTKGELLVQFKDAYKAIADIKDGKGNVTVPAEQRVKALPPDVFATYFRESFALEIKSENIPENKLQAVIDRMTALAQELDITDAVTVSPCFKPTADFHIKRYEVLSPEQNQAIEACMGEKGLMTVAVSVARGRK